MIKAIIFDMDGVLVDACEWHRVALNYALKEVANYEISLEEHYKYFNGIPTLKKLETLFQQNKIRESDIQKIEELKQEKTIEAINNFAFLREEKVQLMQYLKSKNILIGCYTNSIRKTAELMLEKTGVLKYLDCLITNKDVVNPKPDPEGYIKALNYFNIQPHNVIIIEDSPKGIAAAIASGCQLIKVQNPEEVNIDLIREKI